MRDRHVPNDPGIAILPMFRCHFHKTLHSLLLRILKLIGSLVLCYTVVSLVGDNRINSFFNTFYLLRPNKHIPIS